MLLCTTSQSDWPSFSAISINASTWWGRTASKSEQQKFVGVGHTVGSNALSRILDVSPCHCANDLIADGNRPYKQLATKNLPKIRTIGGKRSRELSGNNDSTGYVAVALPVGSLAGEEGVVRRRLHVAAAIQGPLSI